MFVFAPSTTAADVGSAACVHQDDRPIALLDIPCGGHPSGSAAGRLPEVLATRRAGRRATGVCRIGGSAVVDLGYLVASHVPEVAVHGLLRRDSDEKRTPVGAGGADPYPPDDVIREAREVADFEPLGGDRVSGGRDPQRRRREVAVGVALCQVDHDERDRSDQQQRAKAGEDRSADAQP
jgi:hypothetical protein